MRKPLRRHDARPGVRPAKVGTSRRSETALTRRGIISAAASTALAAAGLIGCSGPSQNPAQTGAHQTSAQQAGPSKPVTGSTFAFDTYCAFTVWGDDDALSQLSAECSRYDGLFDLYNPSSDIARVNAAQGAATVVDPDTARLVALALDYCAQADGLFDITIGAVSTLWDFEKGVRPHDDAIANALQHVDWRDVEVDEESSTVRLIDPQAKLDLGGIAKGYIADRLCEVLSSKTKAIAAAISLGGNIAYFGTKPDGSSWNTGIRDPNDPGGSTVVGTAHVSGGSLVTSGLYERTFEMDGATYWHILDPRTGMPVQTDTASVTVTCPSSTTADALSTTLFVAGSKSGGALADTYQDTAAYFIKLDGGSAESSRWQELTDFES